MGITEALSVTGVLATNREAPSYPSEAPPRLVGIVKLSRIGLTDPQHPG